MVKGLKKVAKGLQKASKTHARQAKIVKKHIKKTLKDPEAKYRHDKDRDALNRIEIYQKMKTKKGKTKRVKKTMWSVFNKRMGGI